MTLWVLRIRTALTVWETVFLPFYNCCKGHIPDQDASLCFHGYKSCAFDECCCQRPTHWKFSPVDWIWTNNNCAPSKVIAVKTPGRIYSSALFQIELPPASRSGWSCTTDLPRIRRVFCWLNYTSKIEYSYFLWAGTAGIEPATFRLTAGRSAIWAMDP